MSKILRRPMFRGGGKVSSYGNGIATGLADGGMASKRGLVDGPGGYAGYTSYDKRGMPVKTYTGSELTEQAKKDYFGSGLIEDTVVLGGNASDLFNKYVNQPFYTVTDYVLGTDFNEKGNFGDRQFNKDLFEKKIMPDAYLKYNIQTDQERNREEQYDDPAYKELLRLEKINEIDPREAYREEQYEDGSLKTLLEKQRNIASAKEFEENRVRGGGQDASDSDFEIPVGVTEEPGEQEIGFADMAEEYYNMMGAGADERMAERVAAAEAREDARIKRARGTDISNTLLKVFEGSQQDGATVGKSLVEGSKYLTSKESATERAKKDKETRMSKLEDSAFNREEARRDRAGEMAFKDMMQDKGFDFSNLKSEKDFERKKEVLQMQLDSADTIAEKQIIARRMDTLEQIKNKIFAPSIIQKNVEYLMSLPEGPKKTAALKASGFANTLFRQAENANNNFEGAGGYTVDDVLAEGGLYYSDWSGRWKNDGNQEDGTYLIESTKEILQIRNGKEVFRKTIAIA